MASVKFAHTAVGCKDPIAIERFYTKYFGFTRGRVVSLGEEQIVFIKSGNVYLELFQSKEESPVPPFENEVTMDPATDALTIN